VVGGRWLVVGGWWLGLGAWGLGLGAWCLVRATLVLHLTLVLASGVNENDYYAIWTSCCTKA
jgi:hypothetical protein